MFSRLLKSACLSVATLAFALPAVHAQSADVSFVKTVPSVGAPDLVSSVNSGKFETVRNSVRPEIATSRDLGRMNGGETLSFELDLVNSRQQQQTMAQFRSGSLNVASATYGKTLTPQQFATSFGLSANDLASVRNWLTSSNFQVVSVDNGRMTIRFTGTVAAFEGAFGTEMHTYAAKDGSTHFANATEIKIPAALAGVFGGLQGAHNFDVFRAQNYRAPVTDFSATDKAHAVELGSAGSVEPNHLTGAGLAEFSFTTDRASYQIGQPVTANVRLSGITDAPSGTIAFQDEKSRTIASLSLGSCEATASGLGRSCTVTVNPDWTGTKSITVLYSGDDHIRAERVSLAIPHVGSGANTTVAADVPVNTYTTSSSMTMTVDTQWTGAVQLTGSVTVDYYNTSTVWGKATYPATGSTNSSGSGTSTNGNTYSYACTTTLATNTVSCTITNSNSWNDIAAYGAVSLVPTYSGDANYASSTTVSDPLEYLQRRAASATSSVSESTTLVNQTYGTGVTESASVAVTGGAGFSGTSAYPSIVDIYQVGELGTQGIYNFYGATSGTYYGPLTWTNPATLTPGTYTVTFYFTGNTATSGGAIGPSSTTKTFTVAQQTPTATMTSPTAASPKSQVYGALSSFTVTGTVAWVGTGMAPTSSDISFTSTAAGSFGAVTCTGTGSPYTCSATFTPTSTDAVGSYGINILFSGDTNYTSTGSTQVANYKITAGSQTLTLTPSPVTSPYGSTTGILLTATSTSSTGTPTGTVTFTAPSATYGTLSSTTCILAGGSCSVTFTPSGTTAVGTYANVFSASVAANGNYLASNTATDSLKITAATSSLSLSGTALGSVTTGTTSTSLIATMTPAVSGVTVTFTDTTNATVIGTATTNASGVATLTNVTTATAGVSGGVDSFTASITAGTNYSAATSNSVTGYFQGLLLSVSGYHNFSTDPGTVDGTKLGPFGVVVSNFSGAAKAVSLTLPLTSSNGYQAFFAVNGCPATLAANATCSIAFYYQPPYGDGNSTTVGLFEYSSYLIANANGIGIISSGSLSTSRAGKINPGCSTISGAVCTGDSGTLAGKALSPSSGTNVISVTPGSLDFGTIAVGATSGTQTVTVMNNGTASVPVSYGTLAAPYTLTNQCGPTLAAGASCKILISFSSTAPGSFPASFNITPSAGAAVTVNVTGTAASTTGLTLATTSHNFGSVAVNSTATFGLNIVNHDTAAHPVSFAVANGSGFTYTTNCPASVPAGGSCQLLVTFAPTSATSYSETINVTSDTPILPGNATTVGVTFTGTGSSSTQFTATSDIHNFGTVPVGSSATNYGVVLTNNSGSATTLSFGSSTLGSGFTLINNNCPATLANGASCNLTFGFAPTGIGYVSATYGITSSVTLYGPEGATTGIQLRGTGQ